MTPQREGVDGVDCVALYLSLWAIISLVGVRDFNYSGTSTAGVTDEVGFKTNTILWFGNLVGI